MGKWGQNIITEDRSRDVFQNIFAHDCRLRNVRSEYAPWLTESLKKSMYHRDYLRKMAVKHNSQYFNEAYKMQRNKVNN